MQQNKKINWWAILAVAVIAIPLGFVGTGAIKKIMQKNDNHDHSDTTIVVPTPERLYLQASRSNISFTPDGGIDSLSINSNVEWKITKEKVCKWLTLKPEEGQDNLSVTLKAEKNNGKERSTTISILWTDEKGDSKSIDIVVTQEAAMKDKPNPIPDPVPPIPSEPFLSINPTSITYSTSGGTKSFSIRSNISWVVTLAGSEGWLTVNSNNGRGNKTISLIATPNSSTTDIRSAIITISGTDDDGTTFKKEIHVTQAKSEPLPERVSKDVIQGIVSLGHSDRRVPDGCSVVVNGTKMSYAAFRNKVKKGDYTDIIVQDIGYDSKNVVNRVDIKAAVPTPPVKKLSKQQVQALVAKGSSSDGIAENCNIAIEGGSTKNYSTFRNEINNYSSITVIDVKYDGANKVNHITVNGKKKPGIVDPQEMAQLRSKVISILNSGKADPLIPETAEVIVNGESVAYVDFARSVQKKIRTNIHLIGDPKTDANGKVKEVTVSATENKLKSEQ